MTSYDPTPTKADYINGRVRGYDVWASPRVLPKPEPSECPSHEGVMEELVYRYFGWTTECPQCEQDKADQA